MRRSVPAKIRRLLRPLWGQSRIVLRVALLVSLWHAPVPWVHFHDLEGSHVEELDSLHDHIAEFHAGDVRQGCRALDWHAHLVLPWCLDQHDACPGEKSGASRPEEDCVVVTAGAASLQTSMSLARELPAPFAGWPGLPAASALAAQEVFAAATNCACGWCRHFFETYGRPASVRDLTGVRLC